MVNNVDHHRKAPLVRQQLEQADIFDFQTIVVDKLVPTSPEHLCATIPWVHLDFPCLAHLCPHECHSLLYSCEILSSILPANVYGVQVVANTALVHY